MPVKIFFCYARKDKTLVDELKAHLRPLQREGLAEVWYDGEINAGTEWETEIKKHLNTADIILLLVSPDFMNSDYCYSIEMKRALERRRRGEAEVIPVILRHVYWHGEPLGKLQALPTDGKPVTDPDWYNLDRAFYNVVTGIRRVVEDFTSHSFTTSLVITKETPEEVATHNTVTSTLQQVYTASPIILPLPVEKLALLHTLTGHRSYVRSVAISPDGQTLVTGSNDRTAKIWHLRSGKEGRTLISYTSGFNSVAISPDGQTLVSGGHYGTIKIWNLLTGQEIRTLTGHGDVVWSVAISPNRQILASGSNDHTIKIWHLPSGQEVRTLTNHTDNVWSVAISTNGTLVSGSSDNTVKVWGL